MAYSLKYSYNSASQSYSVTGWSDITTSDNVVIPSTYDDGTNGEHPVKSIGGSAFSDCSGLTSVTIPDSVTRVESFAFYSCSGLTNITIGNSVTNIGMGAFSFCSGLTSVIIGNGVRIIDYQAFYNCSRLTSVTIGNGVKSIGSSAFENCSGLTSVTIPNSVTIIGGSAFRFCSGLTSITIPDSVTGIGEEAFRGCNNIIIKLKGICYVDKWVVGVVNNSLSTAEIENTTRGIADGAFNYCKFLTSVTIPDSVKSIGYQAFYNCSNLTVNMFPSTPPTLGLNAIPSTIQSIYVQQSSKAAYQAATNWTTFASKIVGDNIYLSFVRFNQKNKEYIEKKLNTSWENFNLENGTDSVLVQTTDSNHSFKVMTDGRAKVQTAPVDADDVVRKLELDRKFDKAGGTVTGNMVVGGNFTVQGKTTTVDSETLRVADKLIEVGKGNTAPLTSPAGLITPKYDGTNNGGIVYDHTGTAYVGDITLDSNGNVDVNNSDLQPIATRNATITNDNLVKWDSTNHKLVDAGKSVENLVNKLSASLRSQAYVRNANGEDSGLAYTYTDEGNTLALRNASGQLQVGNPSQDKDATNKSYADNLNARYVSTSILGG